MDLLLGWTVWMLENPGQELNMHVSYQDIIKECCRYICKVKQQLSDLEAYNDLNDRKITEEEYEEQVQENANEIIRCIERCNNMY